MLRRCAAITATQAEQWGIVTRVVPQSELRVAALELAEEISVAHRDTIGRAKSLLFSADTLGFEEALENEIVNLEEHAGSEPLRRSLERFVNP